MLYNPQHLRWIYNIPCFLFIRGASVSCGTCLGAIGCAPSPTAAACQHGVGPKDER